ncbi:MAG: hypothetical protein IJ637_01775 [Prevotella sp.]|nr:hypothetical protein [Prevotella sp.]
MVVAKNIYYDGCCIYTVKDDAEATSIKNNGVAISGHFANVNEVSFGDTAATDIEYWDDSAWSTADLTVSTDKDTWKYYVLNNAQLKDCKVGDVIEVDFTPGSSSEWDAKLQIKDASGSEWTDIADYPIGGLSTAYIYVTEDNQAQLAANDIRIGGCNYTVTDIKLLTSDIYYSLRPGDSNVSVDALPKTRTINVELNKQFDWNATLCVPFDIADVAATFGSTVKAYTYKEKGTGNQLVFTSSENIEAGVPYYMTFGETDKDLSQITVTGVTINTTLNNKTNGGFAFKGNYTPNMDMEGKYGLTCKELPSGSGNWVWAFYKGSTGTKMNAFCAYLETTGAAPSFNITLEDAVTGISTVNADTMLGGDVYNLMGIKTNNATKGIFIKNGKKFVVK